MPKLVTDFYCLADSDEALEKLLRREMQKRGISNLGESSVVSVHGRGRHSLGINFHIIPLDHAAMVQCIAQFGTAWACGCVDVG